ncbi:MAG: polysaccharide deacetylase family protein, partial [Ignavibacteriaceae bacterium]
MNLKKLIAESYYKPIRYISNLFDTPAIILIYHRVTNLKNDPQQLAVKPDNFYEHINFLKKNYNLLEIDEFKNYVINNKKFDKNTVIITFDDGYADNYLEALPILESLDSQALFYISTSLLNTEKLIWWDQLEQIFFSQKNIPASLKIKIDDKDYNFKTATKDEIINAYNSLHPLIKWQRLNEREKILNGLNDWSGFSNYENINYRFLTFGEVKKMNDSKAAVIGAHTHNHIPLSLHNYDEQFQETNNSKKILEDLTQKKINHFSYPFGGKKDYNNNSIKICSELNFEMVCANYHSQVHSWTDKFQLPRILVRDWNITSIDPEFERIP